MDRARSVQTSESCRIPSVLFSLLPPRVQRLGGTVRLFFRLEALVMYTGHTFWYQVLEFGALKILIVN